MEDRFCAIRAAIGTAQPRDVVVIAGKGHQDFQEYGDGEGGIIKVRTLVPFRPCALAVCTLDS